MSNKTRLLLLLVVSGILLPAYDPTPMYQYPLEGYHLLAGTFGELRSNHFHSGIDIKTGGQEGASIYAIEAGYVYRVRVSPYGFGKALYLRHPRWQLFRLCAPLALYPRGRSLFAGPPARDSAI